MRYFRLLDDINFINRWYLGDVKHVNNWHFRKPPVEYMEPCTYTLDVKCDGEEMDYCLTERYSVPILSETAMRALVGLKEIDEPYYHVVLEPMIIANKEVLQKYFVMIIETQIDCVDESLSEFEKFKPNDPVRPDLAGEYSAFFKLVIDPEKTKDRHIFRVKNFDTAIIVSEEVKHRFESVGVAGALFEPVNDDL